MVNRFEIFLRTPKLTNTINEIDVDQTTSKKKMKKTMKSSIRHQKKFARKYKKTLAPIRH